MYVAWGRGCQAKKHYRCLPEDGALFSRYVPILAVLDSHITIKFFTAPRAQESIDAQIWWYWVRILIWLFLVV